jgi:hypothetical protein
VTGFLCRSTAEMVDAVARIGEIDRRACRNDCEARYSADRMVEDHVAAARELVRAARPGSPVRHLSKIAWGYTR